MMICFAATLAVIAFLLCKNYLMKRSARQMQNQLNALLSAESNQIIGICSRDRDLCALANALNDQLKLLRQEHIRYRRGDAALKTAVTNISHDLRTPLTAICGYLEFLRAEPLSPQAAQYIQIITERTDALQQLTDELLQYASAVSEPPLPLSELSVNAVLEESILAYQAALQAKGIRPVLHLTETPVRRRANPGALSRVFGNLLSNAAKYSDGDLEITLSADGVAVFRNHTAALDGLQVGQLFDRFYTVQCGGSSSGLGLSIARVLVEQMGGTVSAAYRNGVLEITAAL